MYGVMYENIPSIFNYIIFTDARLTLSSKNKFAPMKCCSNVLYIACSKELQEYENESNRNCLSDYE